MCRSESRHAHGVTRHALFAAWQAPSTGGCPSHATDGEPPHPWVCDAVSRASEPSYLTLEQGREDRRG